MHSPAEAQVWHLYGKVHDEAPNRQFSISQFPFRIGRQPEAALTLEYSTVSGNHAEIIRDGRRVVLRDLQSTNGTFVNGKRVEGTRPLNAGDVIEFANVPLRLGVESIGECKTVSRGVIAEPEVLTPHFQPILKLGRNGDEIIGFESLARSAIPGMKTPAEMFHAAEKLQMQAELSRILRRRALETGHALVNGRELFLNIHPSEMDGDELLSSLQSLRNNFPTQRITVEIQELAATSCHALRELRDELHTMDMGLAFDDFDSGQARLLRLSDVRPKYLKFDRSLLKDIHLADSKRQESLAALVQITSRMNIAPLAEGIECEGEDRLCREFGFEFAQGFYYGRPASPETLMMREVACAT